jgi:hypothetical protein
MMTAEISKATVFKLGRVLFSVANCQDDFQTTLDILLPTYPNPETLQAEEIHEVQTGCTQDIRGLLNHILKRHLGCIWIDAGALIAPNGKKVLIVGQSSAGKSTTTMALALRYGWKVLGEDLVLIDQKIDKIITFASPFSLKAGTRELLEQTIQKAPDPILHGEWSPLGDMAGQGDIDLPFDLSIFLERGEEFAPQLQIIETSQSEFVRKILRISNLLRLKDSAEKMVGYLGSRPCLTLRSGTLPERLQSILNAVSD